ncbi:anthranilate synthase component I family protein [Microbacterium sp. P01]|uniref:anthranilate synthase component I family protein n=1 Tax=Microbacterium sp. P01 TaxID=3366261 RepID=UPI00366B8E20
MPAPSAALLLPAWVDPAQLFAGGPAQHPHAFWLDAGPDATAGWSWLGIGAPERDPSVVRDVLCARGAGREERPWGPFAGGWVGWHGYDDGAARAGVSALPIQDGIPQDLWLRVTRFVSVDHARRRLWVVAPPDELDGFALEVQGWALAGSAAVIGAADAGPPVQARARHTPADYADLVQRCRDAIRAGDAYQLCLTTRFEIDGRVDAIDAYGRLRSATPAHHGGLVRSAPFALASASPEQFLQVHDGHVRTRPIKGTRPRGTDAASDVRLSAELLASEKERAENVMIVDLMRNDLSQVCEPSTVAATGLLAVESYPAVHQLVSTVEGDLREGTTVGRLWDATFPAGSMTGVPKLSAMTILRRLEGAERGVFAGCYGWIGVDGDLDLAMVIRSIVTSAAGAYVGAGGGITWLSDAADEVAEVGVKARGPLAAVGAGLPRGW